MVASGCENINKKIIVASSQLLCNVNESLKFFSLVLKYLFAGKLKNEKRSKFILIKIFFF